MHLQKDNISLLIKRMFKSIFKPLNFTFSSYDNLVSSLETPQFNYQSNQIQIGNVFITPGVLNNHREYDYKEYEKEMSTYNVNALVKECLHRMPSIQREVFMGKTFRNKKTTSICKELNIDEAQFWKYISNARQELSIVLDIAAA